MKMWLVGLVFLGSFWSAAAYSQDYRPEIIRKVVDPCMAEIAVRRGYHDIGLEEAVDMMKAVWMMDLAVMVNSIRDELLHKGLHRKSYRHRLAYYKIHYENCVTVYELSFRLKGY